MPSINASSKDCRKTDPGKREIALLAEMRAQKQQLRTRIERIPQLKRDFDFLIEKTRLQPNQLITGLWLDCNLMHADRQTLLRNKKLEVWPISEDSLRRDIKNIHRMANEIHAINQAKELSPSLNNRRVGERFAGLPGTLKSYALDLERIVELSAKFWKATKLRIPGIVDLTRKHSLYERVRSSAGQYHQVRLLRLLNVAREILGYPRISQRAFAVWLIRFEKNRTRRMDTESGTPL
jgi:hypothetical protein